MEFVFLGLTILYLVPWMVAEGLEHPRRGWILALVVPTGWTGIGWLAALAWALAAPTRPPPPRRRLHVVGRSLAPPSPSPLRRSLPWLLRGALVLCVCGGALAGLAWLSARPPQRMPASGTARLIHGAAEVRDGPGEGWRTVGTLDAPCTVRLLETQGGWLRFWRLGECPGSMSGGSGWVRDASLVRLDPAASE
jgi:hypothetical protein